jgi:hypothetical protein
MPTAATLYRRRRRRRAFLLPVLLRCEYPIEARNIVRPKLSNVWQGALGVEVANHPGEIVANYKLLSRNPTKDVGAEATTAALEVILGPI